MIYTLMDRDFVKIAELDEYESFIWTDRFSSCGDFELYAPYSRELLEMCQPNFYISNDESEHIMIIENIEIKSDVETGDHISITGRSLECILDRRIVWVQTDLTTTLVAAIQRLLNDAILKPSIADRKIEEFVYIPPTDPDLLKVKLEAQWTGDNLYDIIVELCEENDIGFKIVINDKKQFVMSLVVSKDMSNVVSFSNEMNNMFNSDYRISHENYKNVTLVAGEGEGTARKTRIVGSAKGFDRREIFTDARSVRSDQVSAATYLNQLTKKGEETLFEHRVLEEFEAEVDTTRYYVYGRDYKIGDIVHLINKNGDPVIARIEEMIFSHDSSAKTSYPTFTVL